MYPYPFYPLFTDKGVGSIEQLDPVVISASTTVTSATALPGNSNGDPVNKCIAIENTTNGWAFCNFGDINVADATVSNGVGVPPGSIRIITVDDTTGYVSVILNTGATSGDVRFLRGSGIS